MTTARFYTRNLEDAEDVLQDSFVVVYRKVTDFTGNSMASFYGWVKQIVIYTAISRYQRKYYSHERYNPQNYPEQGIEPEVFSRLSKEEIIGEVYKLPIGYKRVFAMYAIDGYSHKEIAKALSISESTSRSQYVRGRRLLQERLLKKINISTAS